MAQKALISLGSIALALLMALAAAWGAAELESMGPRQKLLAWEKAGAVGSQAEWEEALARQSLALRINPLNASYALDMGRIHEWKAMSYSPWLKEARAARKSAMERYRKAASLRPSWSVAWINLAQAKAMDFTYDQETFAALENAMTLGRWDQAVALKVVDMGFAGWENLPEGQRGAFTSFLKKLITSGSGLNHALISAAESGRADVMAPLLESQSARNTLSCLTNAKEKNIDWWKCKF